MVGLIGLASTMSANILDRTREFGVMHAIGARPKTVRRIVVAEGVLLANTTDPTVLSAYSNSSWVVNLSEFQFEMSTNPAVAPVAMNSQLMAAARLHSGDMFTNSYQGHYQTNGSVVLSPWDRITEPEAVRGLLRDGGIADAEIVAEAGRQPLRSPEDWWTIVLGSGFRWTVEQLGPELAERVRIANLARIRADNIAAIETNAIYAVARKPGYTG